MPLACCRLLASPFHLRLSGQPCTKPECHQSPSSDAPNDHEAATLALATRSKLSSGPCSCVPRLPGICSRTMVVSRQRHSALAARSPTCRHLPSCGDPGPRSRVSRGQTGQSHCSLLPSRACRPRQLGILARLVGDAVAAGDPLSPHFLRAGSVELAISGSLVCQGCILRTSRAGGPLPTLAAASHQSHCRPKGVASGLTMLLQDHDKHTVSIAVPRRLDLRAKIASTNYRVQRHPAEQAGARSGRGDRPPARHSHIPTVGALTTPALCALAQAAQARTSSRAFFRW